jgi:hypothetical protein
MRLNDEKQDMVAGKLGRVLESSREGGARLEAKSACLL